MSSVAISMKGKVAFVTGAGRGIGQATAVALAEACASVAVIDEKAEAAQEVVRLIESNGGTALAIPCDVRRTDHIKAALARTVEAFGRLDCAANNAGIDPTETPTVECTEDEWDELMAVDLHGVVVCMKHGLEIMIHQGGGVIVNIASGAGVRGFKGQPAYVATKHSVVGLSRAAALDHIKQGVRVNVLCPGITDTPMMKGITGGTPEGEAPMIEQEPIGRMGKPEEIADAAVWLCSDAASFVVGSTMLVDGGQTV